MAKNKTVETNNSVEAYIHAIADEKRQKDCWDVIQLFEKQTGFQPKMWGTGIVGFGSYHYKYESGREGDAPLVAFSSRANAIALYLSCDLNDKKEFLQRLGKHKHDKGCTYIKQLADIDTEVLNEMIKTSVEYLKNKYS
jgi:hypothetical protein